MHVFKHLLTGEYEATLVVAPGANHLLQPTHGYLAFAGVGRLDLHLLKSHKPCGCGYPV